MCGSIVIANEICDDFLASGDAEMTVYLCESKEEGLDLISLLDPRDGHSEFQIRKNSCYYEDIAKVCAGEFSGKIILETMGNNAKLVRC